MSGARLTEVLLAHAGAARERLAATPGLAERLDAIFAAAGAAWPGFAAEIDRPAFLGRLGAILGRAAEPDPPGALAALHAADLFLAFAVGRGHPRALALFDERFLSAVPGHLRRIDPSPAFAAEVTQRMRERLLVAAPGETPKIDGYTGRGPLGAWLRVVATRVAYTLLGERQDPKRSGPGDDRQLETAALGGDPEIDLLRQKYREPFRAAFEAALGALAASERVLLGLYFLDGMTVEEIGALYRVHKSTITRRLARAKENLLVGTRERLGQAAGLHPSEVRSVMRLVRSEIDLSIHRLIKKTK